MNAVHNNYSNNNHNNNNNNNKIDNNYIETKWFRISQTKKFQSTDIQSTERFGLNTIGKRPVMALCSEYVDKILKGSFALPTSHVHP